MGDGGRPGSYPNAPTTNLFGNWNFGSGRPAIAPHLPQHRHPRPGRFRRRRRPRHGHLDGDLFHPLRLHRPRGHRRLRGVRRHPRLGRHEPLLRHARRGLGGQHPVHRRRPHLRLQRRRSPLGSGRTDRHHPPRRWHHGPGRTRRGRAPRPAARRRLLRLSDGLLHDRCGRRTGQHHRHQRQLAGRPRRGGGQPGTVPGRLSRSTSTRTGYKTC